MAVGNVSFGQQPVVKKSSGVVKGTVVAAGIGAGVAGGLNYLTQRSMIKNPDTIIESIKKVGKEGIKIIREKLGNTAEAKKAVVDYGRGIFDSIKKVRDFAKAGKIDFKGLGKAAGVGALIIGGTYLAYRGIKALFSKNS